MKFDEKTRTLTMRPTKPGDYTLLVKLEDAEGVQVIKNLRISFTAIKVLEEKILTATVKNTT